MKTSLVTESLIPIRRILSNAEHINTYVPAFNRMRQGNETHVIIVPKIITKLVNKFFKPKELETVHAPIITKMEMPYYRFGEIPDPQDLAYNSAQRKLAEIYVRQAQSGIPSYTVERNIEAMRSVPDVVKDMLNPLDIQADGHIDQNTINKAYDIAKKAKSISPYEYPPMFAGKPEEILSETSETLESLKPHITSEITSLEDNIEILDPRFKIFEEGSPNLDIDSEHLSSITSNVGEALDSDIIQNIIKKSGDDIADMLDAFTDLY